MNVAEGLLADLVRVPLAPDLVHLGDYVPSDRRRSLGLTFPVRQTVVDDRRRVCDFDVAPTFELLHESLCAAPDGRLVLFRGHDRSFLSSDR